MNNGMHCEVFSDLHHASRSLTLQPATFNPQLATRSNLFHKQINSVHFIAVDDLYQLLRK